MRIRKAVQRCVDGEFEAKRDRQLLPAKLQNELLQKTRNRALKEKAGMHTHLAHIEYKLARSEAENKRLQHEEMELRGRVC